MLAQRRQTTGERGRDAVRVRPVEPEDLPQFRRAVRAVVNEHRLAVADHMHMGGAMIVGIDHNPQTADAQDRRHNSIT
jgi:hypothetical protein